MIAFGNVFWAFWKIESFSFFGVFPSFDSPGCTGHFFPKKSPQNNFKTCLDTFRNVFGHFWNFKLFSIFFRIFPSFDPPGCTGQFFLPKKNYLEECWKRVWTLLRKILVILKKKLSFSILLKFFQVSTLQGALGTFFREKTSKQVQNLFGHFWKRVWVSWILRSFCISLKFFDVSTLQGALAKKSRKNHIKTCLDNLGNVFGHFWKFEFFSISVVLFRVSRVHWAEFFSVEIIMQNMIKQCFWERFWRILKVSKFFHFFVFFASFDHPGCTGQKFLPKKLPLSMLKTCLIAFGNVFSGNLNKWTFFQFFEVFPSFDPPGCTGQEKIEKITSSKFAHFLKRFSGFWNFEIFSIFVDFSWVSRVHWAQRFPSNNQSKQSQAMFLGTFSDVFENFRVFLFLKFFPSLDPPGCTGDFFPKKNYLKTGSENVWTILGTALDTLEILKFSIFSNLSLTRPSRVH